MDNELKTKRKIFFVLFISVFSCMLGVGTIVPILPIYAETLGASGLWLGAIFAGFSLSRIVFMPLIGKFSDRMGRKRFIALGLLIYTLSSLGFIYANNVQTLTLVRIIQGFSSAMILPIAMAFIGDISPPEKRQATWESLPLPSFSALAVVPFSVVSPRICLP